MAPRKGLLVDFGGVLTSNVFESFQAFCEAEGLEPDRVRDAFRNEDDGRRLLFDLELGKLENEEFERRFGAHLGLPPERCEGLIERLFGGMKADHAMEMAVVLAKRQGIRTGLISNSWGATNYELDRFPEMFDGWVISGEVGIRKPDPEIYELTCSRLGVSAGECLFVDDIEINCDAARSLGMRAVHFRENAQAIAEIEAALEASPAR